MAKLKIDSLLKRYNLNQKELSESTGINKNTVSKYCNNSFENINKLHVDMLCKYFKCTPNDIFEIDDSVEIKPAQIMYYDSTKDDVVYGEITTSINIQSPNKQIVIRDDIDENNITTNNFNEFIETFNTQDNLQFNKSFNKEELRTFSEFALSWDISQFLNKVIKNVVSNFDLDFKYSHIFNNYSDDDNILAINTMLDKYYLALFSLLSSKNNYTMVCGLLWELKQIYNNGGLEKLSEEEINKLSDIVKKYNEYDLYINIKKD